MDVKNKKNSNPNPFEAERLRRYSGKVAANRAFDDSVKAAEAIAPVTPETLPGAIDPDLFNDDGQFVPLGAVEYEPINPIGCNSSNGSIFEEDLDGFTCADKVALLLRYHNPVKYRGAIFPTNGDKPYTPRQFDLREKL